MNNKKQKIRPLSLKRLYMFSAGFLTEQVNKTKDFKSTQKHMLLLRDFLKYVAVNKDKEL